jgi:hypothetical protein
MALSYLTPFARRRRSTWGVDPRTAARELPGDDIVPEPRWGWTHGVVVDASAADVWPWVAQIGADRGGFYSYEWLENLAGCRLHNASAIHPEWQVREGDGLSLHPKMPPLRVVQVVPGRCFVAHGQADAVARAEGRPWVEVTWLFLVEPLGAGRSRFISRYRATSSRDLATRLQFGPGVVEPIGHHMDRRMLLGVKERAEGARLRA